MQTYWRARKSIMLSKHCYNVATAVISWFVNPIKFSYFGMIKIEKP